MLICYFCLTFEHSNRQNRKWDRSGRITAVLPHNSYHLSPDRSRRVKRRTRAHLRPISLFPIHAGNGSYAPPCITYEMPSIPSAPVCKIPCGAAMLQRCQHLWSPPPQQKMLPTASGATPKTPKTQNQSSPACHSPPMQRLPSLIVVPLLLRFWSPHDHWSHHTLRPPLLSQDTVGDRAKGLHPLMAQASC